MKISSKIDVNCNYVIIILKLLFSTTINANEHSVSFCIERIGPTFEYIAALAMIAMVDPHQELLRFLVSDRFGGLLRCLVFSDFSQNYNAVVTRGVTLTPARARSFTIDCHERTVGAIRLVLVLFYRGKPKAPLDSRLAPFDANNLY